MKNKIKINYKRDIIKYVGTHNFEEPSSFIVTAFSLSHSSKSELCSGLSNAVFYGQRHSSSGLYIITKQLDSVGPGGYRTTLTLLRVAGDLDYITTEEVQNTTTVVQRVSGGGSTRGSGVGRNSDFKQVEKQSNPVVDNNKQRIKENTLDLKLQKKETKNPTTGAIL